MSAEGGPIGIGSSVGAAAPSGESLGGTAVAPSVETPMSTTPTFTPSFSISETGDLTSFDQNPNLSDTVPLIASSESVSPDTKENQSPFAKTDVIWSREQAITDTVPLQAHDISQETPPQPIFSFSKFLTEWKNPNVHTDVTEYVSTNDFEESSNTDASSEQKDSPTTSEQFDDTDTLRHEMFSEPTIELLPTEKIHTAIDTLTPDISDASDQALQEGVVVTQENSESVRQSLAEQYIDTYLLPNPSSDVSHDTDIAPEAEPESRAEVIAKNHALVMADTDFEQAMNVRDALMAVGIDENTATKRALQTFDDIAEEQGYKEELKKKITSLTETEELQNIENEPGQKPLVDDETNANRYETVSTIVEQMIEESKESEIEDMSVDGRDVIARIKQHPQRSDEKSEPLKKSDRPDGSLTGFAETIHHTFFRPDNYEQKIEEAIAANNPITFEQHGSKFATDEEVTKVLNGENVPLSYSFPIASSDELL